MKKGLPEKTPTRAGVVMFNFGDLLNKYHNNSPFNKAVNLFRNLIEHHGFLPSELREAAFLAQYMYEMNHAEQMFRTDLEWEQLRLAQERIRNVFVNSGLDLSDLCKDSKAGNGGV